ncbi:MAG: FAD:protein FMN transferase [Clostridiales bacterium]|nr:FAD:protein FMN transferase [Clostridiales bacterium]
MSTRKQKIAVGCLAAFILLLVFSLLYRKQLSAKTEEPISATEFKLNTVVTVTIYDSKDEQLLSDVMALCDNYENLFSRTKESSEIYQLNHGTLPQKEHAFLLSPETGELIEKALEYSRLSGGAFDPTIEPVSSLWDFTSGEKTVPSSQDIQTNLKLVDYTKVRLQNDRLEFSHEGMGLDLGAIAKGYIADRMKDFLVAQGVQSATINLGGNVLCIGAKPDETPFRIGIQKPFADRSETIAVVDITDKSVVSSGIYERFFEKDGAFYHHILNPKTGYPYDNSLVSVTIISDASVDGDGLSTTCFALGLEKGMELVNSLPDVQAVFITEDGELHYSENFHKELTVHS